jgi:hypothetical protein
MNHGSSLLYVNSCSQKYCGDYAKNAQKIRHLKINDEDRLGGSLGVFLIAEKKMCFDDLLRPYALHLGIKPLWRVVIPRTRPLRSWRIYSTEKTLAVLACE